MIFVFLRPESPVFFSGIKGKQKSKLSVLCGFAVKSFLDISDPFTSILTFSHLIFDVKLDHKTVKICPLFCLNCEYKTTHVASGSDGLL